MGSPVYSTAIVAHGTMYIGTNATLRHRQGRQAVAAGAAK